MKELWTRFTLKIDAIERLKILLLTVIVNRVVTLLVSSCSSVKLSLSLRVRCVVSGLRVFGHLFQAFYLGSQIDIHDILGVERVLSLNDLCLICF